MKASTLNQRHILYGLLVVTLGFSKSWFQTADTSLGRAELASTGKIEGKVNVNNKSIDITGDITIDNVTNISVAGGKPVETEIAKTTATISRPDCDTCKYTVTLLGDYTNDKLLAEIAKVIAEEEAKKASTAANDKDDKNDDETDSCSKKEGANGKQVSTTLREEALCKLAKLKEEYTDRDDLREMVYSEIIADLEEEYDEAETARERREILSVVKALKKEVGDRAIKHDLEIFEKSAKQLDTIANLARESLLYPETELQNQILIDQIVLEERRKFNAYPRETRDLNTGWLDRIIDSEERFLNENTRRDFVIDYFGGSPRLLNDIDDRELSRIGRDPMLNSRSASRPRQRIDTGLNRIPRVSNFRNNSRNTRNSSRSGNFRNYNNFSGADFHRDIRSRQNNIGTRNSMIDNRFDSQRFGPGYTRGGTGRI